MHTICLVLICAGIFLLLGALVPSLRMLKTIENTFLLRGWKILSTLICVFIVGYMIFAVKLTTDDVNDVMIMLCVIMFLGGIFVFASTFLGCRTAFDVKRIAALERDVIIDPLTGAYNRRYLEARIKEEVSRANRCNQKLSVLMIDVDHFKRVNDFYGHQAGDETLRSLYTAISTVSRPSDTIARYGGEELVIISPRTNLTDARQYAEHIREKIEKTVMETKIQKTILVTVSIGVATLEKGETPSSLVGRADMALYQSKNNGRNQVSIAHGATLAITKTLPKAVA
jgi:two-component system, cell cycle response regulator